MVGSEAMKNALYIFALMLGVIQTAVADNECKTMTITGNSNYPPLSWRDRVHPDTITSIAVEVLEMAMKEKGVTVRSVYLGPWKRAHNAMREGKADAIQNAYINEERKTYLEYTTTPYIMDPTVIFIRKGYKMPKPFTKKEDLLGMVGASPLGESYGDDWDNFAKKELKIDLTTSIEVAFKKLLAKRVDFVVFGEYPGLAAADVEGIADRIEYLPNSVINEGMYIAFAKNSPCLKYKDYLSAKIAEYSRARLVEKLLPRYRALWKKQSAMPNKDD